MELSKQEMELLLPLPGLWAKNFLYNIFSILTTEFKIDFQNRKWNYSNRKRNYFCHFQASDQKTFITTLSPYLPRNSKLILKTGNGIIQIRNGIIFPTSRPLIKKLLLQHLLHFNQEVQNWFSKQEMELLKQERELFPPLPGLLSINFFYNIISILTKALKIDIQNRKWNFFSILTKEFKICFQTGNGIISSTSRTLIK